ncbi:MAG: hypothetical protein K0S47_3449 [Herbinix sp.]|nr:hypothetical protein [Herbinix sp.]
MPLPMVHLATAREYANETTDLLNCPEFYLGSISPDAIHMRQNILSSDKGVTHLFAEGDLWKENVTGFIKQNKSKPNYNFILGYGIHILTDIIWNETLYRKFQHEYEKDATPLEDIRLAYYNDTDKLDFELYRIFDWRKDVWKLLERTQLFGVEGILSTDEINAWNNRTLHWFDHGVSLHKNPIRYISVEDLLEFIQNANKTIKRVLETEGL